MTPIQDDPNHQFNSIADTTLEQAQLNTRRGVESEVAKWNAAKVTDYEGQWTSYVVARDARPDATNLVVPVPARAEAVYVDTRGWPYIDVSDKPVIAPHTYVPAKVTPGGFFTAGASDGAASDGAKIGIVSALLNANLYGEPIVFAGMKFLRVA